MRATTILCAWALCAPVYCFFADTSPFILLSTAELPVEAPLGQLQFQAKVTHLAEILLSSCPTDRYLIASLPNIHASDLAGSAGNGGCDAMPNLCRAGERPEVRTRVSVSDVLGMVPAGELVRYIRARCAHAGRTAQVAEIVLPALPKSDRPRATADNDYALIDDLEAARVDRSYTILFVAGPREPTYMADFEEPLSMDLRRDDQSLGMNVPRRAPGRAGISSSLFQEYQFFTPGIFVGLTATILLLSILTISLKALGSLEVSYAAFDSNGNQKVQKKN